jgi:hypothetical protein|tara:strand:- start:4404 stop:4643 length:240 start_codon:yes stop_codon:yes gene_type:complete
MKIPRGRVVPYAAVFIALAVYLFIDRDDPTPPRQYGCEKVYRLPPMWRCGEYGTGANNNHVVRIEAWVSSDAFHVEMED